MDSFQTAVKDGVLTCTFNRPAARNAMTWEMYEGLHAACERADDDPAIKVVVLRGAGDKAFVAGTDIAQFEDFASGADGVAYEARFTRIIDRLENVDVPTVAAVRGACVGGGLADRRGMRPPGGDGVGAFRGADRSHPRKLPVIEHSMSFLLFHLGPAVTLDLLLRAELLTGPEAHAQGFVRVLTADDGLDAAVDDVVARVRGHAPVTIWAAKEITRRARRRLLVDDADVVSAAFGSDDFAGAVRAFATKTPLVWRGR